MKIAITGALGHIGSSLIRKLPEIMDPIEILMIDNLSTERYCSLYNLNKKSNYTFMEADILNVDLNVIFDSCDIVIHLAAITNATDSFNNKEQIENVNFIGSKLVAEACLLAKTKLLFISTTSVYGSQKEIVDETTDYSDLNPQSPYAKSKLDAEKMLFELGANGLVYSTFRFGTIFSTSIGMRFHTCVNKFCWQAVNGLPLSIWRTALNQVRPYLDLNDAVNSIIYAINKNIFYNETYNILTGNYTVKNIVECIESKLGQDVDKELIDSPIMNQLSYNVENEKFKKTGFIYEGDIKSGVNQTIELLSGLL